MNGYELLHRIGEGGMGVVHLARRPGEVRVALKVLRPSVIGDDEARARLAQEVSSLARIRSPRIAEIVDSDPWGDIPYVATRYVPGWSLHKVVQSEGPLPPEDLEHFAGQLVEAMAVVHAVGVVHRDIKPSNVLLEGRNPVLIDFGLARVADDARLTHDGWMLGTPGYLAPEILYGTDASSASDVHAWAATVLFAATGRPPFGSGPALAVMDRVRRGEHDLTGVPQPLAGLLDRALSIDPADRPTVRQLRAWFSGEDAVTSVHQLPVALEEPELTRPMMLSDHSGGEEHEEEVGEEATAVLAQEPDAAGSPRPTAVMEAEGPTTPFHPTPFDPYAGPDQPGHQPHGNLVDPYGGAEHPLQVGLDEAEPRPSTAARVRSGLVTSGVVAALSASLVLAPILMLTVLAALVWVVRSGSMAADAARRRRDLRGARWYDSAQNVGGTPWYLLRALPGAVVLVAWGAGMALAALLLCYAFSAAPVTSLSVAGVVFTGALWLGPGTDRWSRPLARATAPFSRDITTTLMSFAVLAVVACVLVAMAQVEVHWWPWHQGPVAFLR